MKNVYEEPIVNTIVNGGKLNVFSLKLGTTQECPFLPVLVHIVLKVVANAIKQEKEYIWYINCCIY